MIFIRRRLRHDEAAPDDDGTEDVRERFHCVRDERLRMAEDAREKFRDGQRDVRGEAEERGTQTAFEAGGRHAEINTREARETHATNQPPARNPPPSRPLAG